MKIVENILNDGIGPMNPSYICVHETANAGASALAHVSYWSNSKFLCMTQYVGDWTDICYHVVPDNRYTYQVGNGNQYVIGIELCHATNQHDFDIVWKLGIDWCAYMLRKHNWGIDRLISHNDARIMWGGTDHTDPAGEDGKSGYFGQFGRTWEEFKNEVAIEIGDDMAIDYELLADRVADKLMRYKLKGDNGYEADIGQRICRMDDKTQTIVNNTKEITKFKGVLESIYEALVSLKK